MNIENFALKVKNIVGDIEFNEESLNYPVLSFNILSNNFKFFYQEDFLKRTKFHKKYNTFLEIKVNEKSELLSLKAKIEEMVSCSYCIKENKIYLNISKVDDNKMVNFINKIKNNSFA